MTCGMSDTLDDRRRALEEEFFSKQNKEKLAKLAAATAQQQTREELTKLTGIRDDKLLDALAGLNVGAGATLVLSLYPIVAVAWADGNFDSQEKKVVTELAKTLGIEGTPAESYLNEWLASKPEPKWFELWAEYTKALAFALPVADRQLLEATVLARAKTVAEVSGGFLGVAFRVSAAEQAVLDRLAAVFR